LVYTDPPPDLPSLAAAYAFGIARNHPFVDGNKRTAFVVCRTFLKLNGSDCEASHEEKYLTFLQLAEGNLDEDALAVWLRDRAPALGATPAQGDPPRGE
jgi:death-on-curing protein